MHGADDPFVIAEARELVGSVLDELAPRLVADSGRTPARTKSDGSLVTDSDEEVDHRLTQAITARFPTHGIVSEESGTVAPETPWTWIIDPIDGTSNFVAGVPYWCISVALARQGTPVLGIVDAPVLSRRYVAVRGEGTRCGRETCHVRGRTAWDPAQARNPPVMLTTATTRRAGRARLGLHPRVMGSTALDLALVAHGVALAAVATDTHVWDIAAGALLVAEAGGHLTTVSGTPLLPLPTGDLSALVATTAAAAEADEARHLARSLLP